jgi:hypothetical protein
MGDGETSCPFAGTSTMTSAYIRFAELDEAGFILIIRPVFEPALV